MLSSSKYTLLFILSLLAFFQSTFAAETVSPIPLTPLKDISRHTLEAPSVYAEPWHAPSMAPFSRTKDIRHFPSLVVAGQEHARLNTPINHVVPLVKIKRGFYTYIYWHFVSIMEGPISSYSFFDIHTWWNVLDEARMEPPNQLLFLRSVWLPAACTFTLLYRKRWVKNVYIDYKIKLTPGTIMGKSLLNLSEKPGKSVLPPVTMTLLNNKGRKSISHALILFSTNWDTPTVCWSCCGERPNEGIFCVSLPGATGGFFFFKEKGVNIYINI